MTTVLSSFQVIDSSFADGAGNAIFLKNDAAPGRFVRRRRTDVPNCGHGRGAAESWANVEKVRGQFKAV